MCVEDEKPAREILCRLISMKYPGCKVHTAENGSVGLDTFKGHGVDIVLTDLNMPVMDGVQMAREMRGTNPNACIIALTAYNIEQYPPEESADLFDHFLPKPVNPEQLFNAIDDCVSRMF